MFNGKSIRFQVKQQNVWNGNWVIGKRNRCDGDAIQYEMRRRVFEAYIGKWICVSDVISLADQRSSIIVKFSSQFPFDCFELTTLFSPRG